MILAVREGHQISRSDASRMSELAEFGPRGAPTMPEARKDVTKPLSEPKPEELIRT